MCGSWAPGGAGELALPSFHIAILGEGGPERQHHLQLCGWSSCSGWARGGCTSPRYHLASGGRMDPASTVTQDFVGAPKPQARQEAHTTYHQVTKRQR